MITMLWLMGKYFLLKNNERTNDNFQKIATGQGDDYTTGCLLDYIYFKNYYKTTAIALSKQKALDADMKATTEINFTPNLDLGGQTGMFFIIKEKREIVLDFSQRILRWLWFCFILI